MNAKGTSHSTPVGRQSGLSGMVSLRLIFGLLGGPAKGFGIQIFVYRVLRAQQCVMVYSLLILILNPSAGSRAKLDSKWFEAPSHTAPPAWACCPAEFGHPQLFSANLGWADLELSSHTLGQGSPDEPTERQKPEDIAKARLKGCFAS